MKKDNKILSPIETLNKYKKLYKKSIKYGLNFKNQSVFDNLQKDILIALINNK